MRENRFIGQDRCYHLISRLACLAFYRQNVSGDAALRADASPSLQVGLA